MVVRKWKEHWISPQKTWFESHQFHILDLSNDMSFELSLLFSPRHWPISPSIHPVIQTKLGSHLKCTPPNLFLPRVNVSSSPIDSISSIFLNALSYPFQLLLPFADIISHVDFCNNLLSVSPLESNPSHPPCWWEGAVCKRNLMSLPCSFSGSLLCHDCKHIHTYNASCRAGQAPL